MSNDIRQNPLLIAVASSLKKMAATQAYRDAFGTSALLRDSLWPAASRYVVAKDRPELTEKLATLDGLGYRLSAEYVGEEVRDLREIELDRENLAMTRIELRLQRAGTGAPGSWALAGFGLIATIVVLWLAFVKLARDYEAGLQTLSETPSPQKKRHGKRRWTKPRDGFKSCATSVGSPSIRVEAGPGWLARLVWSTAEANRQPPDWRLGSSGGQPRIPRAVSAETYPAVQLSSIQRHHRHTICSSLVPMWPGGMKHRESASAAPVVTIPGCLRDTPCAADQSGWPLHRARSASRQTEASPQSGRSGIRRYFAGGR